MRIMAGPGAAPRTQSGVNYCLVPLTGLFQVQVQLALLEGQVLYVLFFFFSCVLYIFFIFY